MPNPIDLPKPEDALARLDSDFTAANQYAQRLGNQFADVQQRMLACVAKTDPALRAEYEDVVKKMSAVEGLYKLAADRINQFLGADEE